MPQPKNAPNTDETPAERFIRLAVVRTNRALEGLKQLSDLATDRYEYTDEQVQSIKTAIDNQAAITFTALTTRTQPRRGGFTL